MPQDQQPELQIGGQAVIEGVVMRSPEKWALAVRRPSGDIYVTENPVLTLAQKYPRWNVFPVRGMFALADSLVIGMKALSISGGISLEELGQVGEGQDDGKVAGAAPRPEIEGPGTALEQDSRKDTDDTGDGPDHGPPEEPEEAKPITGVQIGISIILAMGLFVGLFFVLPAVLAKQVDSVVHNTVLYNLIEGGIRIGIFILYLAVMGFIPDLKRVFQYHGAEHKVVHAYESGEPLTASSAEKFSTAHLRCGTAFVLIVFVLSILVFSLMGRPALWLRVLERIAIIPFVAAISYEIIRFAGRHEKSRLIRAIMSPGLLLQKLTTRQPDDDQLEVAIRALEAATGMPAADMSMPAASKEPGTAGAT